MSLLLVDPSELVPDKLKAEHYEFAYWSLDGVEADRPC